MPMEYPNLFKINTKYVADFQTKEDKEELLFKTHIYLLQTQVLIIFKTQIHNVSNPSNPSNP